MRTIADEMGPPLRAQPTVPREPPGQDTAHHSNHHQQQQGPEPQQHQQQHDHVGRTWATCAPCMWKPVATNNNQEHGQHQSNHKQQTIGLPGLHVQLSAFRFRHACSHAAKPRLKTPKSRVMNMVPATARWCLVGAHAPSAKHA